MDTIPQLAQKNNNKLKELEVLLGHKFSDVNLLQQALIHSSYGFEQLEGGQNNETLEFIGDAVLDLAVSDLLFHLFSGIREGELTKMRAGGGYNHRFNLADGVLIKDNHIQACGSIKNAVARMREKIPHTMKIEVEAATVEQVRECLSCSVDIIMLDNMEPARMREAVKLAGGRALLEASGGINLDNVRGVAETGVDYISIGALTHSAPACDISMRLQHA